MYTFLVQETVHDLNAVAYNLYFYRKSIGSGNEVGSAKLPWERSVLGSHFYPVELFAVFDGGYT